MASVETASVCAPTREAAATSTFLTRLASDDAFRADLKRRPAAVLAELGLAAEVREGPVTLPSKEEVRELLARRSCIEWPDPSVFTHAM